MKILAIVSLALGVVATASAFLFWAGNGIPYQDATAEMLSAQEQRGTLLALCMLAGMAISLASGLFLWRTRGRG